MLLLGFAACDTSAPTERERHAPPGFDPAGLTPRPTVSECGDSLCASPDRPWSWTATIGTGTLSAVDTSVATFSFPQRTLVRLTVIGRLARIYHPDIPASWNLAGSPYPDLDADGEWLGGNRSGEILTMFSGTGATNISAIGASPNSPSSGTLDSFTTAPLVVRGTGPVRRRAFQQPSYPAPPACNGMTGIQCVIAIGGQQGVRIEIVSNGQLTLSASPVEVASGDDVTFTASAGGMALQVHEWVWRSSGQDPPIVLASGVPSGAVTRVPGWASSATQTSAASCLAGETTCTIPVYGPGTMWIRATVGSGSSATVQAASAGATAYPQVTCPTGDSLLDLPATRALLRAVMERTETETPKVEWAGYVYRLPDGSHRFEMDTMAVNGCNSSDARRSRLPGWTPVLLVHSHPAVPDALLPSCGTNKKAKAGPHGGILSHRDWDAADPRWHPPPVVPVAVIDPESIAIGRTGEWTSRQSVKDTATGQWIASRFPNKAEFDSSYSQYPRETSACVRP